MTKEQAALKTEELIGKVTLSMREHIEKALNSGAIDVADYGNDYELPKIILGALLREETFQWRMHTDEGRKAVENLARFI